MNKVNPHVFRAYDIRGKAYESITSEFCNLVGLAFGEELKEMYKMENPVVIVGRDARTHSPEFEDTLTEGLMLSGCHVKLIGQTPSPVNYFALCHFEADGSIQITASHNEAGDNGLKIQTRGAEAYAGKDLQKLRKKIENMASGQWVVGSGQCEEIDAITPYIEKIISISNHYSLTTNHFRCSAAADFGNGVSGPVYMEALQKAGVEVTPLFEEPDGTFPNHIADPSKHDTLTKLIETVKNNNLDFGIAFDGDGDRVGFVDENGNIISPDYILLLLAEDHLSRKPGGSVVYTVSMSGILDTEIQKFGGDSTMCEVGHSFVEHKMREEGAELGGEQSGHFFCGEDYYGYDDALVAALRVISIFNRKTISFSSLFSEYPKIFQIPEWRPHCDDDKKTEVVKKVTEEFQKDYPCITIDGVRIDFGNGAWAGIRQSNTSPKLSICIEARNQEKLNELEKLVKEVVGKYLN
ncbi:phosphomannomutase/phosphoglucomutase [Candidatus Peribacteria bacterium]|jgi:phosphomannomutase / phosphoglucomutase|nr:phosphomannomutase/phosphoglucomutase [Candidatus Peribacteria bacterium]MBT4021103.1 phosphomannomutase/phosphoglucomutase [Candidatus Peribacteria bacterium]MBT4240530.1 phosphomannomutase/phosphoglucomutase [Candidatus Peribacteria bacterium]MBT4474350.1 phosphomannomutase/phosphoglucomutase [Candidatus Peribacteria bacterium]